MGTWASHYTETVEDQQKFLVPLNRDTEKLYYNQNIIFDGGVIIEPRNWRITKVNRTTPNGLCMVTLYQENFNSLTAGIMYKGENEIKRPFQPEDKNKNVKAWYADYYSDLSIVEPSNRPTNNSPEEPPLEEQVSIHSIITYSGLKPQLKVGGSYKKFTINFYDNEDETDSSPIDFSTIPEGEWKIERTYTDKDNIPHTSDLTNDDTLFTILTSASSTDLSDNQIKIKFLGDGKYIGSMLDISYTTTVDGIKVSANVEVEIIGL